MTLPAWALPIDAVLRHHGVDDVKQGLSSKLVEARRQQYGYNELQKGPATPLWKLILEQFNDTLVKVRRRGCRGCRAGAAAAASGCRLQGQLPTAVGRGSLGAICCAACFSTHNSTCQAIAGPVHAASLGRCHPAPACPPAFCCTHHTAFATLPKRADPAAGGGSVLCSCAGGG